MCKWGDTRNVLVKIPEDLSCTGFSRMKFVAVDGCIASVVEALQRGCVDMRGSCCGHNKSFGEVHLQDDRVLVVVPGRWYYKVGQKIFQKIFDKIGKKNLDKKS